jgi:hypothetical protein
MMEQARTASRIPVEKPLGKVQLEHRERDGKESSR